MSQKILLVEADLIALSRMTSAGEGAGAEVVTATTDEMIERLRAGGFDLVVLDLDRGRERLLAVASEAASLGLLSEPPVGFVSHVDGDLARAARAAGVKAEARGRFWSTLVERLSG